MPNRAAALTVDGEIEIRLARIALQAQIFDSRNLSHHLLDLFALLLREHPGPARKAWPPSPPLVPVSVSSTLSSMGCEKFQKAPGYFCTLTIHGSDQFVLVLMEDRPPLFLGLQVHEILRIAESSRVGSIVGRSGLRYDGSDFGERGEECDGIGVAKRSPSVRLVLLAIAPRAQIAPSLRWGKNSAPMIPLNVRNSATRKLANPTPMVTQR